MVWKVSAWKKHSWKRNWNPQLKENIKQEQYTRRENLRFNNITELKGEDSRALICGVIQNEMDLEASNIKIPEDRNEIWSKRGKIEHSENYPDAYITKDFAKAIRDKRKVLIKELMKARESQEHPTRRWLDDIF